MNRYNHEESASEMMKKVRGLKDSGKSVSALCACRAVVSFFPEDTNAWEAYLDLCDSSAGLEEKLFASKGLLEWSPENRKALRIAAESAFELNNIEEAGNYAKHLAHSMPDKPVGWMQLSRICRASSRTDEAMAYIERALYLNPRFASGLLLKAVLLAEKGDAVGARRVFEKAHGVNPALAKKTAVEEKLLYNLKNI